MERIAGTADNEEDYALSDRRLYVNYVARSCTDTPPPFKVLSRPHRAQDAENGKDFEAGAVESADWEQLKLKAIALVERTQGERRTEPFRGSMERGIDARRTLRSHLGPTPRAWVFRYGRQKSTHNIKNEPIVWIFQLARRLSHWSADGRLNCLCCTVGKTKYCQYSRYLGNETEIFKSHDGNMRLDAYDVLGQPHYFDVEPKKSGKEFERRAPLHSDMSTIAVGCVLDGLLAQASDGLPWWEILIRSGLEYAESHVLCIVPDGFRPSSSLLAAAAERCKKLMFARVRQFSRGERNRMMKTYRYRVPAGSLNDAAFKERARNCMRELGIW